MQREYQFAEMQLYLRTLLPQRGVLRMHRLPPSQQRTAGLFLLGRGRENLRPIFPEVYPPEQLKKDLASVLFFDLSRTGSSRTCSLSSSWMGYVYFFFLIDPEECEDEDEDLVTAREEEERLVEEELLYEEDPEYELFE